MAQPRTGRARPPGRPRLPPSPGSPLQLSSRGRVLSWRVHACRARRCIQSASRKWRNSSALDARNWGTCLDSSGSECGDLCVRDSQTAQLGQLRCRRTIGTGRLSKNSKTSANGRLCRIVVSSRLMIRAGKLLAKIRLDCRGLQAALRNRLPSRMVNSLGDHQSPKLWRWRARHIRPWENLFWLSTSTNTVKREVGRYKFVSTESLGSCSSIQLQVQRISPTLCRHDYSANQR
mmetsp:Transcript_95947/g.219953  ORF Transcript_95947/g.219953 Transcript_95947/m.219953 type:complete len:233 (+) Transcript_95947:1319-2017(+)